MEIAGVMARSPLTISAIVSGPTPIASAKALCEIPIGMRYSSDRISPAVIGFVMIERYYDSGCMSMIIDDGNFLWA
jgi:hypothetical protein